MKWLIILAVILWLFALVGTLVFRGNIWSNLVLLAVSLGMVVLGLFTARRQR